MYRIGNGLHSVRKFLLIRCQPISDVGLPSVVDLKEIARLKHLRAALEIGQDRLLADLLVPVIPARIALDRLIRNGADAHLTKPAVEYARLVALGKEQRKYRIRAAAFYAGAVALYCQKLGFRVILKKRIPGVFVERGEEPEKFAVAYIPVALAVSYPLFIRIIYEVVIAVPVKPVMIN